MDDEIRVGADETGVWCEDRPGFRSVVPWTEITRVAAYKLNCMIRIETFLAFEHESGHLLELSDNWPGFDDVRREVSQHCDLQANWFAAVEALTPDDDVLVLWQRKQNPAAG